jgi:broad specificity phosphatase PhoE
MSKAYSLLLVRHAQADHHLKDITGGWTDTDLTELGLRQTELLAGRLARDLAGYPLHLGVSHLHRAVQTAQVIGQVLNLEVHIYPGLADLSNGVAAGKTHAEARHLAIPPSEPIVDWQPYPEAESWRQFYNRVSDFIEVFTASQQSPAILVTHAAVVHAIIGWWLDLPANARVHFDAAPASLTVLKCSRWNEPSLERLNDTAHLEMGGIGDKLVL